MITTSYPCQAVCVVRPLDIQQQLDILSITTSLPGMLFEKEQFLWHKVTTNIVCNKLSVHTKYARKRILKYVKLNRDRSGGELYERSIYERYSIYKRYSIYRMNMSEFFIGKYAIAISTY